MNTERLLKHLEPDHSAIDTLMRIVERTQDTTLLSTLENQVLRQKELWNCILQKIQSESLLKLWIQESGALRSPGSEIWHLQAPIQSGEALCLHRRPAKEASYPIPENKPQDLTFKIVPENQRCPACLSSEDFTENFYKAYRKNRYVSPRLWIRIHGGFCLHLRNHEQIHLLTRRGAQKSLCGIHQDITKMPTWYSTKHVPEKLQIYYFCPICYTETSKEGLETQ
jgi:hypothetical protein